METITVTADKRAENIQDVPVAITAFTETELEDAGIEEIGDVIDMVPNMTMDYFASEGSSIVSVRGLRVSDFTGKNPMVIYVDGVPLDSAQNYDADLFNLERVEVLRGPQGTLYGKNAIGGVINVISKKPGNTFESKVTLQAGENETYGVKAFVNGPVVKDKLFFGISSKYFETRGFMKNDNPDLFTSALNVSYKTRIAEFTSITTYKDAETDILGNNSYLNTGVGQNTSKKDDTSLTQEFRIQSGEDVDKLKWLAGLYYSDETEDYLDYGITYPAWNVNYNWPGDRSEEAMAAFGQITIPLLSSVNFTTGVRYERIHKEMDYLHKITVPGTGEDLSAPVEWSRDGDWDALLPKAVVAWEMNKDALLYVSVAQGYLAGGFNAWGDDRETAKFDEQTSVNYEMGTKTSGLSMPSLTTTRLVNQQIIPIKHLRRPPLTHAT